MPNLSAPKLKVSKEPQTILGMVRNRTCDQCGNKIGLVNLVSNFMILYFFEIAIVIELFIN